MAEEKQRVVAVDVPIKFYGSEDVVAIFADVAAVSHTTGVFVLSFYQVHISPPEQKPEDLKEAPAKCVSRVVLTEKLFRDLLAAMESNLEKFNRLTRDKQDQVQAEEA